MRLLQREKSGWFGGTYTFSLTKWDPHKIPAYAILSHRWGADEVTFKDIENGAAKTKDGYKKLEFCAEQAARDGVMYFWIDTCCIDKSSSTELSEAINSMFKWYQKSTKCYVYLSDVSAGREWEQALQRSEWFSRGWTLQELIAPTSVEFFSVEGEILGDRKSLERQINQITGISIEALKGKPLNQIDQRERFSWTVRRQTTVEEDAVYCLLGIFDVHISLIYGEGQQKALARLQREIGRSSQSNSFAARDAPWIVPFERNPHFTGRETELDELEGKLFTEDHTSRVAVTGLGGVGKTQLVLELLYRTKRRHKDCIIMWISANTIESLQQGYVSVAQQLGVSDWQNGRADAKKVVQDYLSQGNTGPWILVFDNADDITMWTAVTQKRKRGDDDEDNEDTIQDSFSSSCRLIDYLPRNNQGCIIFTTRDMEVAVRLAQPNIITVLEMSHKTAVQLLTRSLANPHLVEETQDTSALLEVLTYLPLAITQSAAYINTKGISLGDYVLLLKEKEEEVIDTLSEEFEDFGRYQNLNNSIATTWLISFEQIRKSNPLAANYLSFMACISPRDIPQSVLPPGASRKKELDAIGTLKAYSFISQQPASAVLDLHRLVHLVTRNWLRKEKLLDEWTEKTLKHLAKVFPDDDHKKRTLWRAYLPHVRQILGFNIVNMHDQSRMELLWKYGLCLYSDGRWNEAEVVFAEALAADRETLGEEHPNTLTNMDYLARTYKEQGRWDEAEQLQIQALEISRIKLGIDSIDTLSSMSNLASIYNEQGRWDEAEQLKMQILNILKTKHGADHPETVTNMGNLARLFSDQNRLKEAEELEVQVLEIRKTKLGIDHPETLTSMINLASTYGRQDRWEEAEELGVQVLEIRKTKLGIDHPDTLRSMSNLAVTYHNQDRLQEAESLLLQALKILKTKLGIDHPDTLCSMSNLAATYSHQKRWKEAESLEAQVLETKKIKLGIDHPSTLTSMHNLAYTWKDLGRHAEAIQLMQECVQRGAKVLGTTHPNFLESQEVLNEWQVEWQNARGDDATSKM